MNPRLLFSVVIAMAGSLSLFAQNTSKFEQAVSIRADGQAPDTSAMLDIQSLTKGMLVPRMSEAQRLAIPAPAQGLLVFETTSGSFWYFSGGWTKLSTGDNLGNHTATGILDMSNFRIMQVMGPINGSDAANKDYVDAHTDADANPANEIQDLENVLSESNDAGGFRIGNLANPVDSQDAATKAYVDDLPDPIWSENGTKIFYNDGFVGIGDTDPENGLSVKDSSAGNGIGVIRAEYTGPSNIDAIGIHGISNPGDFYGIGVQGNGGWTGVLGIVEANGSASYKGVSGQVSGSGAGLRYGLTGTAIGGAGAITYGVWGSAASGGTNYGVYGTATGLGENFGVYGKADSGSENWAGYFDGNSRVLGRLEVYYSGTHNTCIGFGSGSIITTGNENTVTGYKSGFLLSEGSANSYIGYEAGRNNRTGSENCALGMFAMSNNEEQSKNVAIGSRALLSFLDGYGHDPVAGNADLGTTYNLAIGTSAGQFTNDPLGIDAERNTFVGNNSGLFNSTGYRNAFFGFQSGDGNLTGRYLTCIGHEADVSSNNLVDAVALGASAIVNANYKVRIGNTNISVIEGQVDWSFPSDGRFKKNVEEDVPGLDFIARLRPITYNFDAAKYNEHIHPDADSGRSRDEKYLKDHAEQAKRATETIQTGLIAQEVEVAALSVGYDFNGVVTPQNEKDNYGMRYSLLVVPLIKAVQEQQAMIAELLERQAEMEEELRILQDRLEK